MSNPVNLTLSGYVGSSSRYHQGSSGFYWSSTVDSSGGAYDLRLSTSTVNPANHYNYKHSGFSVRCIAR